MSVQSPKWRPVIFPPIPSVTSSQVSQGGLLLPALPAGPTTANSGPARRPASRSASRESSEVKTTNGTCGPTTFASSVPDGPLSQWESRLRQRLARLGSTECLLTWKASDTPGGRPLSRLVPSMRHIGAIAFGSSPSEMALWVTASARDWKDSPNMATTRPNGRSRIDQLPRQVAAALWNTPTSLAPAKDGNNEAGNSAGLVAIRAHALACWPTPNASGFEARDAERLKQRRQECKERTGNGNGFGLTLGQMACLEAHGQVPAGSSATTEKPGALNPAFVCWLMGFPPEWDACAPTAMPSSRKSRQN